MTKAAFREGLVPALLTLALLILWQAASPAGGLSPFAVAHGVLAERSSLLHNAIVSASEAVAGLVLAIAIAFLAAAALVLLGQTRKVLMPLIVASQTVPLVAIAPLVAQVIGSGPFAIVLITAWLCWFPAVITFFHGFRNAPPEQLALFAVARATPWQTFVLLRLPAASASLTAGVRASAGFALIGTLVAEYGAADQGLGAMIIQHVSKVHVLAPEALTGLVLLCAGMGVAVTWGAYAITRQMLRIALGDYIATGAAPHEAI